MNNMMVQPSMVFKTILTSTSQAPIYNPFRVGLDGGFATLS